MFARDDVRNAALICQQFPDNDAGIKGSSRLYRSIGAWDFHTRGLPPSVTRSIFVTRPP